MPLVISVVNQKGGVGKTTTAVNLGAYLAQLGKNVLLVDLDPQANATSGLGVNHEELPHGLYDALVGRVRFSEIIRSTAHEGLRLAPATASLAGANVELVSEPQREHKLHDLLLEAKHAYEYIIVDCPPSLGLLTVNGIVAADRVLIPVQAEYFALEGLGQLLQTVNLVKEHLKPEVELLGAVITMFDSRNKLSGEVMEELYKAFPATIFRSVVPRSVRLAEAPSFGKTILGYDAGSRGGKAYERLAREIVEKLEGNSI